MNNMTAKEWVSLINSLVKYLHNNPELRVGQVYMNALFDIRPDLYQRVTGTENDCFYNDDKIVNLIGFLNND